MRLGFDYFRLARDRYVPATPRAALRALEGDLMPEEAFSFLATSARPLDEEPVSLEQIDRILSREDLDLSLSLLVMRVLRRLLKSPDPEVTLFAAESINRIESRYTEQIESIRKQTAERQDGGALRLLAPAYYQLAQIYPAAIRSFYLREAFGCIKQLQARRLLKRADVRLLVRILLDLQLPAQALGVLKRLRYGDDPGFLLLEAEVEFQRRNLTRVRELCLRLAGQREPGKHMDQDLLRALDLWKGA